MADDAYVAEAREVACALSKVVLDELRRVMMEPACRARVIKRAEDEVARLVAGGRLMMRVKSVGMMSNEEWFARRLAEHDMESKVPEVFTELEGPDGLVYRARCAVGFPVEVR